MSKASVIIAVASNGASCEIVEGLHRHQVRCWVADGGSCLQRLLAAHPRALVVIDVVYQGQSGLQLCRSLADSARANLSVARLCPVILHSNRTVASLELALHGLRRGAHDVLLSPFDESQIAELADLANEQVSPQDSNAAQRIALAQVIEGPVHSECEMIGSNRNGMTPLQRQERKLIIGALEQTGGHVVNAAQLLRMGQATVYRKIRRYQIPRYPGRPRNPK